MRRRGSMFRETLIYLIKTKKAAELKINIKFVEMIVFNRTREHNLKLCY